MRYCCERIAPFRSLHETLGQCVGCGRLFTLRIPDLTNRRIWVPLTKEVQACGLRERY